MGRFRGPNDAALFAAAGEGGTHANHLSHAKCWGKQMRLSAAAEGRKSGPGFEQARAAAAAAARAHLARGAVQKKAGLLYGRCGRR